MQMELLAFLRARKNAGLPDGVPVHRHVEGEMPFVRNGQIIAYADAAEILTIGLQTFIALFEIKPKIETVFGIVRQAKALLQVAETVMPADMHALHLVVPHNDPALADLRREWPHTWAWGWQP